MSFFDIWPVWAWITSTIGIVGLVIMFFLAPTLFAAILNALLRIIGSVIRTPLGAAIVCGALCFGAGWFIQGLRAAHLCNLRIEEMQARADRQAAERDKLQGAVAESDDDARLAEIVNTTKSNQERFNAFKAEIAKRHDAVCRLKPTDLAGLRLDGNRDTESCSEASGTAKADDAGRRACTGRDAVAALADYRAALREANERLAASAAWYEAVRKRYRAAPLR